MERKPSETAAVTASLRALGCYEEDERIRCRDETAKLFLPEDKREQLKSPEVRDMIKKMIPEGLYAYVLARTGYFDDLFVSSLQEGIPQIVLLGAGYDSRPYRFSDFIGTTILYEADALATQEQKRFLLKQNGISAHQNVRYVALDFERDDLMRSLCGNGFDPELQTLYLWEGVTFYLHPATVRAALQSLRVNSAVHSIISFDFQTVENGQGLVDTGLKDETICFGIEKGMASRYLEELSYKVLEHVGSEELQKRYLTQSDGSLLGQIKPIMNIVKAGMV